MHINQTVIFMKKCFNVSLLLFPFLLLCSCSKADSVNLLHFTDNLNKIKTEHKIELEDYYIYKNSMRLLIENDENPLLLTLEEDENGKIKKARLTLSKTDNKGNIKNLTEEECLNFFENACNIFSAYTFYDKEESLHLVENVIPQSISELTQRAEHTADADNFHLVYYSNEICSQFSVSNTFLEKPPVTKKPDPSVPEIIGTFS